MVLPQRLAPSFAPDAPVAPVRPRILIADDCEGTREVVAHILADEFEPVVLDNGVSAWERIESDPSIAALITDITMPGLTGYELIDRIRGSDDARVHDLPIIAITGAVDNETRRRVFVSGATGLIPKPIDRDQLLALAHVYFRQSLAANIETQPVGAGENPAVIEPEIVRLPPHQPQLESVEFDAELAERMDTPDTHHEQIPVPELVCDPPSVPPTDPMAALSVAELEEVIQREARSQAGQAMTDGARPNAGEPAAVTLSAELISIDAALDAIHKGRSDLLIPYRDQLAQRIQPLLAFYRKHLGKDVAID